MLVTAPTEVVNTETEVVATLDAKLLIPLATLENMLPQSMLTWLVNSLTKGTKAS